MSSGRFSFAHDNAKKVILVGNSGVGKTSLAAKWVHGSWDPGTIPTVGAANCFKDVEIGQNVVRITLWDTAGQEQYRSIAPLYIRGARIAIVVAATDSTESFHSIPVWLELLAQTDEVPIPALLAVNKSDVRDPWQDEGIVKSIELYRENFLTVFAVSAATGDQVDELFGEAARIAGADMDGVQEQEIMAVSRSESKCC
jgi:small GTP-binding protein